MTQSEFQLNKSDPKKLAKQRAIEGLEGEGSIYPKCGGGILIDNILLDLAYPV